MGCRGQSLDLKLTDPAKGNKDIGHVFLRGEAVSQNSDVMILQVSGRKLDQKGWFSKNNPFFTFSRSREDDGQWLRIHKSEVIMSTLNPQFSAVEIPLQKLCNGDVHRPLQLEVWDWNTNGKEVFIGSVEVSVDTLVRHSGGQMMIPIINKNKSGNNKSSGGIVVKKAAIFKRYSMLDYLRGGCEISMICCIDFTASNGPASDYNSLHFMDPSGRPNEYQSAISAVGSILEEYDHDKQFPVYGFGGIINGTEQVSHCFPLTFDPNHVEVDRVAGILGCYVNALQCVRLHGPTCFAPIIRSASDLARQYDATTNSTAEQKYIVLLIITDGVIMDMDSTRDAIVAACNLPLSIIIVGVGNADFSAMEQLDGDDEVLRATNGTPASRDIVQFVPFSKYKHLDPSFLARDTLIEVPEQLTSYMRYFRPHLSWRFSSSRLGFSLFVFTKKRAANCLKTIYRLKNRVPAVPKLLHGASTFHTSHVAPSAPSAPSVEC